MSKHTHQLVDLTEDDMQCLNGIHKKPGMHRSLLRYHTNREDGTVFGWTYDDMGWNMVRGGIVAS